MGSRKRKLPRGIFALGVGAMLALSGCGTADAPPTGATPASLTPTAAVEPTATQPPIVFPADCSEMNKTAASESTAAIKNLGLSGAIAETDLAGFRRGVGPAARAAMEGATRVTGCAYPLYLNGQGVEQWIAELPQAERQPLIDSLRTSEYRESTLGAALRFTLHQQEQDEPGMPGSGGYRGIDFLFLGDAWITLLSDGQGDYAGAALDGLLAANPAPNTLEGSERPAASAGECAGGTGLEKLAEWAPTVPGGPWDLTGQYSDIGGYDACATLSWIVLRPEPCCTRFSVTPVLFFLNGSFYQLATTVPYALGGEIERVSDNSATVTYMWQAPGGSNAAPPATARSTFTLNPDSGLIERTGELPPN